MGLHTKHIFLSSTIREFAGKHNAICIKIRFSQRWTGCGWISRKAGLLPCLFDVGGSAGVPPGGGGVWRPRGGPRAAPRPAKQKSEPGAKGPGRALSGRFAPSRRPPGTLEFPPALRSIHHPFPPRLPIKKPSPPLPMSGGPAPSAGTPEKFSSQFSPAFLKAAGGQSRAPPVAEEARRKPSEQGS